MRIYHTLGGQYLIHDREFSIGTIVLHLDNGIEIFCNKSNFYSKKHNLHVLLYLPDKCSCTVEKHKTWIASPATIPKSGERNRKIHSCMLYLISI